jgi:GT2 family glycosyltransferase
MSTQPPHGDSSRAAHPTVSVVIPTHNNLSLLLECLDSLRKQDYPQESTEIIVVDNASTDRTGQVLTERFPHIKLVSLDTNTGFAAACNRGASAAKSDYLAFLNNDALADKSWLSALVGTLQEAGEDTVCAASRIMSRDGEQVEFDGASSNLFGAGRPSSVWGWPDMPAPPTRGSAILFASGGAMLIKRSVFLDVGGFDPSFFAYFEDVDLGWRLWILGYRVVYAPDAMVRHIGGATGRRAGEHRRYVLWECNSLATVIKNYEHGNMERILSAALMLQYKRALLSTGDAIDTEDYRLVAGADKNAANMERVPKVSVAHIAAIDRLSSILPELMKSRREIQARRQRSDEEILRLLGRPYEPQYAGRPYADASRALASALQLYEITAPTAPNRVLIIGGEEDSAALSDLATRLAAEALVAVALVGDNADAHEEIERGYSLHQLGRGSADLARLVRNADLLIAMQGVVNEEAVRSATAPVIVLGREKHGLDRATLMSNIDDPRLRQLSREPR